MSARLSLCQDPCGAQGKISLLSVLGLLMWGALSNKRMGLSFTIAAGPCQRSRAQVRVPRDSWPYFTISDSRLPKLEGQIPIFISPRNRVAHLYPRALGSLFIASYDSQGYGGGIRTRLHMDVPWLLNVSLMLGLTASWPVCLGVKHPSGAQDQISIPAWHLCVSDMRCPLWRNDGSFMTAARLCHQSDLLPMISSGHFTSWVLLQFPWWPLFCLLLTRPYWAAMICWNIIMTTSNMSFRDKLFALETWTDWLGT
jgi:hypothetical protein